MKVLGAIALIVLMIVGAFGLAFVGRGGNLALNSFFMPKEEAVRRNTFEQSKAYRQGMIQDLEKMQVEYVGASTQEQKDAIASLILHNYADFDENALPTNLYNFVQEIKRTRGLN